MNCTPLDVTLDDNNQSYFYHTLRPYSLCNPQAELAWGIPMLVMYGLAFPLCLSVYILRSHATELAEEFNGRLDVRFLFSMYKPKHTWWVVVVFLRRFLLPVCIQAFKYQDSVSTFFLFFILAVSAVGGAYMRPFIRARDNIMDALSLMTLVVTYFFAALRQASNDDEHSGAAATAIVVLVLNVLTLLALAVCLCLDFKWVVPFVYRSVCAPKRIAETAVPPVDMPADIEAHDNPLSGLRQEMIELKEVGGNKAIAGLARDNQDLAAQLEASKSDIATLKTRHLAEHEGVVAQLEALKVEMEGLRRRSQVTQCDT
jgi:hypothetical protein